MITANCWRSGVSNEIAAEGLLSLTASACKARAAERAKAFADKTNPDAYVDVLLALAKA
jgi:hypothetical protein